MPAPDLIELFARPLQRVGARYLVAGSIGSMLYSEPRLTVDIDLAVALSDSDLRGLPTIFPEPDFYCPPFESLRSENRRECRGHFNIIHLPSGLKADFYPQHDAFFEWSWDHRKTADYPEGPIEYAPPEYVLLWKASYYSEGGGEKHARDAKSMLAMSRDLIDFDVLRREISRRGLEEAYRKLSGETL